MLCLHVEEYNSRPDEANPWFWVEIIVICPLPFVGMCYTKGKSYDERDEILEEFLIERDRKSAGSRAKSQSSAISLSLSKESENQMVDCGYFMYPIEWSEIIHDTAAGIFFGGLTLTNLVYTMTLMTSPSSLEKSPILTISLFTASVINLGVLVAFVIINKLIIGYCDKKGKTLRVSSFVLECLNGALVIIVATLCSMKRNDSITWLD